MSPKLQALAAAITAAALLSACASTPHAGAAAPQKTKWELARERYLAYAGPPIDHFTWFGRFDGWEALGRNELVVFTTPTEAYYIKVWPSCDLRWANTIGISSTTSSVFAHFDAVLVHSPAGLPRCPIDEIRRIDYRRMRAEMRAGPQANKAGQQAAPAPAAPAQDGAPPNAPPPPPAPPESGAPPPYAPPPQP
jgi:hypothetical protein